MPWFLPRCFWSLPARLPSPGRKRRRRDPQEKCEATQRQARTRSGRAAATWPRRSPNRTGRSTRCSAKSRPCARNRKRSRPNSPRKQAELDRATEALEAEEAHLERVRAATEPRARRPPRAAGRDLRVGLAGRAQRDPRIRATGRRWPPRPNTCARSRTTTTRSSSRVKGLRDQVRAAVERLDAQRAKIEDGARRDRRQGARSRRRPRRRGRALRRTEGRTGRAPGSAGRAQSREARSSDNLSAISEQIASDRRRRDRRQLPAPLNPGQKRRMHHRKPGQRAGLRPRRRSRTRSKPPTRSPPRPTSGAAATAPSNRPATTARARSATRCTAAVCWKARSTRPASRPGANPAPAVDHRLRQLRPRLDDHRRPRLRHRGGPGPRWHRPGRSRPKASSRVTPLVF